MSAERNQLAALLGILLLTACDLKPPAPGRPTETATPAPTTPAVPASSPTRPAAAPVQAAAPTIITRTVYGEPQHRYTLPGATNSYPAFDTTELGRKLQVERVNGKTILRLPLDREEAIWGFGQRMDAFDLRGTSFEVWAEDSWNRTDTSYFAVPWLVSSHGYGLFINCTGRLKVDIGRRDSGHLLIEIPEEGVEIWAITGTPADVVSRYTDLVGRPHPVPDWTFRPWLSRNSFLSAYEVDRHLARAEKYGLKFGAVVLEAWERHLHNFQFETNRYPNPAAWIRKLNQRGVQVVCWTTASIWTGDPSYEHARDRGFLVRNADGSEYVTRWLENGRKMDFRLPEARAWWRDLHHNLIAQGVGGFKTDGGEHMPDPWFHNEHPFHYQRATLDAYAAAGRIGLAFARSANPLCAGNSTFWGGDQHADWSNLAVVVRGGLSAAWSGFFYWSHDVGGYTGTPEKELYLRWLQIGAFSPMMQLHGITAREPWHYDAETIAIARGYFKVREQLQPYLVELARQARASGLPMWRPLPLVFPADPATWSVGDQFMLGDDLLVAPILTTTHERRVYLPAGAWLELGTLQTHIGPTQLIARADLSMIPVFARAEQAERWRHLLRPVPRPESTPLLIELTGPRNERGLVPDQRYLKPGHGETISLRLRNQSPVNAEGVMTLPLPTGFRAEPAQHPFRLAPGQEIETTFNVVPPPNLAPGSYRAQGLCRIGNLTAKAPPVHLVRNPDWKVLGPLPVGMGQKHALDGRLPDVNTRWPGRDGHDLLWQDVPADAVAADGWLDVGRLTARDGTMTCYAFATVSAPNARRAVLKAGSGDALTIWWNGQEVLRRDANRNPERDEDSVEVMVRGGVNTVLLRTTRSMAPPGFYFRLADVERNER